MSHHKRIHVLVTLAGSTNDQGFGIEIWDLEQHKTFITRPPVWINKIKYCFSFLPISLSHQIYSFKSFRCYNGSPQFVTHNPHRNKSACQKMETSPIHSQISRGFVLFCFGYICVSVTLIHSFYRGFVTVSISRTQADLLTFILWSQLLVEIMISFCKSHPLHRQ